MGSKPPPSLSRRVIEEVPHVKEAVVGHAATGAVLQVKQASGVTAKLYGMASENLGSHVFVAVSPLIEDVANTRSKDLMPAVMLPIVPMLSTGNPTGDCGLSVTSFYRHPAAFARSSLSKVGEKVWFQMTENASLIWL